MPVPLTTSLLVIGAVLSPLSIVAACIFMGLGLLNQLIVEVVSFPAPINQTRISGDDDDLG